MRQMMWVATLLTLTVPGVASAAVIDFTTGGFNLGSSLSYSAGGFDITATPGGAGQIVVQNPGLFTGLGVYNTNILLNSLQIDGANGPESLNVAFSGGNGFAVRILSVVLGRVGTNDDVVITLDGAGNVLFSGDIPGGNFIQNLLDIANSNSIPTTGGNNVGTVLTFGVPGSNDDYVVRSITFEATPEPATLLVFGALMGGAGVIARRRGRTGAVSA